MYIINVKSISIRQITSATSGIFITILPVIEEKTHSLIIGHTLCPDLEYVFFFVRQRQH